MRWLLFNLLDAVRKEIVTFFYALGLANAKGKTRQSGLYPPQGFGDLLEIGNQARPKIFDLTVRKPSPL